MDEDNNLNANTPNLTLGAGATVSFTGGANIGNLHIAPGAVVMNHANAGMILNTANDVLTIGEFFEPATEGDI